MSTHSNVRAPNNANLINQSNAEQGFEYYTPAPWPQLASQLMGGIDLDPASNEIANASIKAKSIFTKEVDGLSKTWHGTVWMNHPFHRGEQPCSSKCKKKACIKRGHHINKPIPGNGDWINKVISEYESGNIKEAVIITFCNSSEGWFLPLLKYAQCFPNGRVHYIKEDGSKADSCTKGSVITYIGKNVAEFARLYGEHGTIKVQFGIV
ncbi:hypothetical protein G3485_03380 [Shewanella baltica]|uniref:hypothetical protein n=1 Tax=Shewanella baltica TaxID=62322 RepID=UPI00217D8D37|nr:hypothetical protein [Shewanella baltica]MCS6125734.1 hypothetical protein [Shewanella baltica]MCS6138152.1 hypothetical protein [Shewanella baltica]MCS6144021.1 hypothetical protein [Shewanella baltica]MCS6168524.1 hypothetical protein [Shewanella baltica]MCS6185726.1 hypothetical protein [Shewanella baltica]